MKLIQLNIWGGKLNHQVPDFLKRQKPDIVCMQEVHDLKGPSGAVFATLDEIQEYGNFKYRYMSPSYASHYQKRINHFGNAILSQLKITSQKTVFTHGEYNPDFDLTMHDYNVRNFQHVTLETPDGKLQAINHHGFLLPDTKEGDAETLRQMKMITEYIRKLSGPVILAGDFNLEPGSNSIKHIEQYLHNLPVEFGIRSTYNQFNSNDTVCDYIFVNDHVKVTDMSISDELVSDHKALILEFEI